MHIRNPSRGTDGADYQHIFQGGSPSDKDNPFASCFILKFNKSEHRSAVDGKTLYHLPETEIDVTTENGDKTYKFSISAPQQDQPTFNEYV